MENVQLRTEERPSNRAIPLMTPSHAYHVGRDPLSDIVLDDARVSWHHAVLRPDGDHWTLADEHSTNGTYADGRRVPTTT